MKVIPIPKPVSIMVAAFYSETNQNHICLGEGFTISESVARAVDLGFTIEEVQNISQVYGDDIEGLMEWYLERGIYLSEPIVIKSEKSRI